MYHTFSVAQTGQKLHVRELEAEQLLQQQEKQPQPQPQLRERARRPKWQRDDDLRWPLRLVFLLAAAALLSSTVFVADVLYIRNGSSPSSSLSAAELESCAWPLLAPHQSLLDVPPISHADFLARQRVLAAALADAGADAFVAEPSASSAYYANVSASFALSERPFLVVVDRAARFSYLVPTFEAGRIAALDMVFPGTAPHRVVAWAEEEDPYAALARALPLGRVMLDEHARFMIAAGLRAAGVDVVPMTPAAQALRAIKTPGEIAILEGVNAFTLALVRALQGCVCVGVTQEAVTAAGRHLFSRAGLADEDFWAIVLFGDQAAYPHGGQHGKTLAAGEFVLVDIGSALHGYGSDVTRTFLPLGGDVADELIGVWQTVHAAQAAAFARMREGSVCADVDAASRRVIVDAGYGPYYTHRLGHGLGLEMHEHPYLNGANRETLKVGEVATNEPGIYVTAEQAKQIGKPVGFGVRLEDPILVTEDGGRPLTGRRAQSPWDP